MVVICHTYPDWVTDWGKNLAWDWFCHGLTPSLQDALGFAMAELPEREQAGVSFNTLYTLAKKMEVWQPSHPHRSGSGSSDAHRDKYRRYPASSGWVAMLEEEELLPPDPKLPDYEAPEPDVIEGLSLRMITTRGRNAAASCCGATDHFARDCPHQETFHAWHKEHLNSKGAGPQKRYPPHKAPHRSAQFATMHCTSSLFSDGPTAHWIGPETLVSLWVEGREINNLADSGSQENMVIPSYVYQHVFQQMLPLRDLVDHSLNLVGVGSYTVSTSQQEH